MINASHHTIRSAPRVARPDVVSIPIPPPQLTCVLYVFLHIVYNRFAIIARHNERLPPHIRYNGHDAAHSSSIGTQTPERLATRDVMSQHQTIASPRQCHAPHHGERVNEIPVPVKR